MWIRAITFWDSANYLLEGGEAAYWGTRPGACLPLLSSIHSCQDC